jgi:hypothetical protein
MEQSLQWELTRENSSSEILFTIHSTWPLLGFNPGRCGSKPPTNDMECGTAFGNVSAALLCVSILPSSFIQPLTCGGNIFLMRMKLDMITNFLFLDLIHHPVFYSKHSFSETAFYLFQVGLLKLRLVPVSGLTFTIRPNKVGSTPIWT